MGIDPRTAPDSFLRRMPCEERRQMGVKTTAEVNEHLDAQAEKQLQTDVKNLLEHRGIVCNVPKFGKKTRMKPGWPDCTFAVQGKAVAFEFKGPQGKLSPDQLQVMAKMEANGWRYYVIRSVEQARQILNVIEGRG